MRVMVTGANGLVGRALVQRLLALGQLNGRPISRLLLLDQALNDLPADPRLRFYAGTVTEAALFRRSLADGVDVVFHLAGVPCVEAEGNYALGNQVNLKASLELLDQLRLLPRPAVLVYASSVAVYGGVAQPHGGTGAAQAGYVLWRAQADGGNRDLRLVTPWRTGWARGAAAHDRGACAGSWRPALGVHG